MIVAKHLVKTYGYGRKAVAALCDVSFSFNAGRVTGLIGHNGAGKSTFIKTALGFLTPTSGEVEIFGLPPGTPSVHQRLGYLPEHPSFPLYLSGREILIYVARLLGFAQPKAKRLADELLEEVGIAHAANRRVQTYSKGMGQRLGLAQALIGQPELLILDEPMTGLDPIGRSLVKEILRRRHQQGTSIVFCSHILEDVERLCNDIVMLNRGAVVYQGSVDAILTSENPHWLAMIRCASLPSNLSAIGWQPAGDRLWTAPNLEQPAVQAIAAAAAGGQIEVIRLNQQIDDLEAVFVRLTKGGGGDA